MTYAKKAADVSLKVAIGLAMVVTAPVWIPLWLLYMMGDIFIGKRWG